MRRALAAAALLLLLGSVQGLAQGVNVIGAVTPGHCVSFFSTSQIQDAGGGCAMAGGGITGPGVSTVGDLAVWNNATGTALADTGLSFPGGFSFAGTLTGATAVTFPTSGTLATTANANVASVGNAAADTSLTIAGTGTGPWTGAVTAKINLANAQTWTAAQTFANSDILLRGSSTGTTTFTSANAGASNFTLTFPAVTANLTYLVGAPVTGNCVKFSGTVGGITDSGAVCGGGGGAPGGASGSIQYNNAAAFGGFGFTNATSLTALGNGATAQQFIVYNTVDTLSAPVNFERAVVDWTTAANTLTIAAQVGGTGTPRRVEIWAPAGSGSPGMTLGVLGSSIGDTLKLTAPTFISLFNGSNEGLRVQGGNVDLGNRALYGHTAGFGFGGTGISVKASLVWALGNGGVGDSTGWFNYGGQARVTSDFSVTSSTALVNVTGLSVNVQAGRTYQFEAELYVTDAAAGGVQAAIAGTATATAIQYVGFAIADNAIKAKTNATALATAVASTVTTETAGIIVRITGTITVNAAGTLTVQMAQNTSNATPTIAKRGSWFIVQDMP